MQKRIVRGVSLILSIATVALSFFMDSFNISASKSVTEINNVSVTDGYSEYLDKNSTFALSESNVSPISAAFENAEQGAFGDEGFTWINGEGEVKYIFTVTEAAFYNVEIVWKPIESGLDIELGVKIDGEYPFEGLKEIELIREWKNSTKDISVDSQGNEYAPEQVAADRFITTNINDSSGIVTSPYKVALSAGEHTVSLVNPKQKIQIKSVRLVSPENPEKYVRPADLKKKSNEIITIQGEMADIKTSNSIIPKSDNDDAGMQPHSPYKVKINYIGGTSWQLPGERLEWNFEAPEAGYYSITMRYKQAELVNGESIRSLKIDGKAPFKEATDLRFLYGTNWEYYTVGKKDSPYYVWLDKGPHTFSLEVTLAEQAEYFNTLSSIVDKLGDEYIKIVKITGESPDMNRDYELFNQIPGFIDTLTDCRKRLDALIADMKKASGKNSTQAIAAMENMSRVLSQMVKNSYSAQQYVSDYYSNYTSLCSWIYDMQKMPLSIDEIQLVPFGKSYSDKSAGFFKQLKYDIIRLALSFTADYVNMDNDEYKNTITIWVGWGQDQTSMLESLIKESFTPKTGINVDLKIVNSSLINGIISGNAPDLSLQLSRATPVNLGIRGAVTDLKQFPDYKEVLKNFRPGAEMPYSYNGKLYALPDSQNFYIMFYRKDILDNLGLSVPNTWDEFLHSATIIQRNNMNVYLPYGQITSSTSADVGIGSLNLLPTLMLQNNLSIYNKELNATDLLNDEAINVFNYWTEFYTDYMFLKEADFYNRFRVGVMPLGIAQYNTYYTIASAAPEIQNRWSIALVPGTVSEDGSINRTISGSGTGCTITEVSTKKKQAWEFLKWWVSAETQTRYSNNLESILGLLGRVTTSNVEALKNFAWKQNDLMIIDKQWSYVNEIPEVPGSYYLSRSVDQAFWSVVNGEESVKDALIKWSAVADAEINRKINEFID